MAKESNYTLNITNLLEYLNYASPEGEFLHTWLGMDDKRAVQVAKKAYDIVWDEIEKDSEVFDTIKTIKDLLSTAEQEKYNDVELMYFLYRGFAEIDGHINPAIEFHLESEEPPLNETNLN